MQLYILRHGIALDREKPQSRDADRPLTAKGQRRICRIAAAMKKLGLSFDRLLSSPYIRARQTAQIVAQQLDCLGALDFSEALKPGAPAASVLEMLRKIEAEAESVLLVGHEPGLSNLVSRLTTGGEQLAVTLKKGGLCKLDLPEPFAVKTRRASLQWLLTPKQMKLMAGKN